MWKNIVWGNLPLLCLAVLFIVVEGRGVVHASTWSNPDDISDSTRHRRPVSVPEPATIILMATGGAATAIGRWYKRRQ